MPLAQHILRAPLHHEQGGEYQHMYRCSLSPPILDAILNWIPHHSRITMTPKTMLHPPVSITTPTIHNSATNKGENTLTYHDAFSKTAIWKYLPPLLWTIYTSRLLYSGTINTSNSNQPFNNVVVVDTPCTTIGENHKEQTQTQNAQHSCHVLNAVHVTSGEGEC